MATRDSKSKNAGKQSPALRLARYWLTEQTTLEEIALRARVALEADSARPGAHEWNSAQLNADRAKQAVAAGMAEAAVYFALAALRSAFCAELLEKTAPSVARDAKRQAGTRKPRRPQINEWIARRLKGDPDAKAPELWGSAPDWICDVDEGGIRFDSFKKRVTQVRKMRRK